MTSQRQDRAPAPARKFGYLVGAVVNAVLLYLANVRPGWRELPFLTERMSDVLPLINLSLLVSVAANVLYLVFDPVWFRSLGQIAVAATGLVAALRTLQVFPFDFSPYEFDWATVARVVLVVAVVGSAISIVVELVRLVAHAGHATIGGGSARPRGAV
ncbi:hypothetical protein DDP54_05960 [Cellulomonas sp. WB94]|uniref:hypothetical protein n=1 Tax=Cellulomonas sp. WB94 TaxID=2173174 RepID=UPI000D58883D|nr:hypothetical protein [Cellulomonas sp. WB94]PVU82620.1 hypothetical protein DDP54_05960 [Cellulomonas sp. WB94]